MLKELDKDNLEEILVENEMVFVQYSAGWCGNCRIIKPKFGRMSEEHENAVFLVVDAEKNPASRKLANVTNLPTFAAFKKGELLGQLQTNKEDRLKTFIDEVTSN